MCTGTCTRVCVWVAGVLSTLSYIDASDGKHSREIRVLQVCSALLATAPNGLVSGAKPTFSFPFSWAVYASVYHLRTRLASGRERRVLRKGRGACVFNNCQLNY